VTETDRTWADDGAQTQIWNLRLYVAGGTPRSVAAFNNLKQLCEDHLKGRYKIEVIDLMDDPGLAREHQIVAIPTLVRTEPSPARKLIGDLSDVERAMHGLDLKTASSRS